MTTAKEKTYVTKAVTVPLDENSLDAVNAAAKTVSAPGSATVAVGGGVPQGTDAAFSLASVTFGWSEEV